MGENVCVLGMGYVGLTLALALAEKGVRVHGVDVDRMLVEQLNSGNPHFHEAGLTEALQGQLGKNLVVSASMPGEKQHSCIICVGTPIDRKTKKPVMEYITSASRMIAGSLRGGELVVLRSTIQVGTSRKVVKPILDSAGVDYFLAFCPERTAEGKAMQELLELPQVVGGIDAESAALASRLFRKLTSEVIEVSSLEAAEAVKLLNNSYRDLTFAYANEVAVISEKLGLDALELIRAANQNYARSNIPQPGFVGGVCLEKDSHMLVDAAGKRGFSPEIVRSARALNEALPSMVAARIAEKLTSLQKEKKSAKIFISGFAFKGRPETDDVRASPTIELLKELRNLGFKNFFGHDFIVEEEKLRSLGVEPCRLEDGFENADCVIIANNHRGYGSIDIACLEKKLKRPALIVDCWRAFERDRISGDNIYMGIGFG